MCDVLLIASKGGTCACCLCVRELCCFLFCDIILCVGEWIDFRFELLVLVFGLL